MAEIDQDIAQDLLEQSFRTVEDGLHAQMDFRPSAELERHLDALFRSKTQAFREVLLGCLIARLLNKSIDIRLPYVNQGSTAYNARDLDEAVINPFLKLKQIPSSKGPFLSVFRRGIKFDLSTRAGLRDKRGYDSFLALINIIASERNDEVLLNLLTSTLAKFIALREESNIAIARVQRLSLPQIDSLMKALLRIPSGGRFPVFLIVSTFAALNKSFTLEWEIAHQGINVADAASGDAGDITVRRGSTIIMAAEVTERVVARSRVISTFTTKIAPLGIQDYLFFVRDADPEAYAQAHQYFSQGVEVNFVKIEEWIRDILAVIGSQGRVFFLQRLIELLMGDDVPRQMKVGWNDLILKLTSS